MSLHFKWTIDINRQICRLNTPRNDACAKWKARHKWRASFVFLNSWFPFSRVVTGICYCRIDTSLSLIFLPGGVFSIDSPSFSDSLLFQVATCLLIYHLTAGFTVCLNKIISCIVCDCVKKGSKRELPFSLPRKSTLLFEPYGLRRRFFPYKTWDSRRHYVPYR